VLGCRTLLPGTSAASSAAEPLRSNRVPAARQSPVASDVLRSNDAGRDARPGLAFLVVGSASDDDPALPFESLGGDAEAFADVPPLVRPEGDADDASAGLRRRTTHRDGEVAPVTWDPLDSLGPPDAVFGPDDSADFPARYRIEDDLAVLWPTLKDDVRGLATWQNAGFLAVGLGTALAFRPELDDRVRTEVARHPQRWGEATEFLGNCGNVEYQIPVIFALYGLSLWHEDERLHSWSTSSMSALTVTGLTTLVVKAIADTDRPSADWNDGRFGFPSYHTSSSFALAAVAEEHYGPWIGLPAYAAAGLIGWSRLDAQDHDLSDVVFGAALGYTIGKTIAHRRLTGDSHWHLLPLSLSSGHTTGLAAAWDY
jgi:hypothetical protein